MWALESQIRLCEPRRRNALPRLALRARSLGGGGVPPQWLDEEAVSRFPGQALGYAMRTWRRRSLLVVVFAAALHAGVAPPIAAAFR